MKNIIAHSLGRKRSMCAPKDEIGEIGHSYRQNNRPNPLRRGDAFDGGRLGTLTLPKKWRSACAARPVIATILAVETLEVLSRSRSLLPGQTVSIALAGPVRIAGTKAVLLTDADVSPRFKKCLQRHLDTGPL